MGSISIAIRQRGRTLATHRQQTQAKAARERTVRERRARKLEKKHAAAAERKEQAAGGPPPAYGEPRG
jgi:hypothetical protein